MARYRIVRQDEIYFIGESPMPYWGLPEAIKEKKKILQFSRMIMNRYKQRLIQQDKEESNANRN